MRCWIATTCRPSVFLVSIVAAIASSPAGAQDYVAPRTAAGHPDLNGIWQAIGSHHWDIEPHAASHGPVVELGALGALPAGLGIVQGNAIPYTTVARAHQQENRDHWLARDPAVKCNMPGVPRATYMPYPFQLVQTPEYVLLAYEFANAGRIVYMNQPDLATPGDTWMGHNSGRWEGETLVVDVTGQVADTWLDSSGNHHSGSLHVEERYTAINPNHIVYEATITDPETYTRPWTITLPLYRRIDQDMQLIEYPCVQFTEGLMYGHLRDADPAAFRFSYHPSGYGSAFDPEFASPGDITWTPSSRVDVRELVDRLVDAYNDGVELMPEAFSTGARLEPADGERLRGRSAIVTYYNELFDQYRFELTIRDDDGPLLRSSRATYVACYALTRHAHDDSRRSMTGQLTIHAAYSGMQWTITKVIFTDDTDCEIVRGRASSQ